MRSYLPCPGQLTPQELLPRQPERAAYEAQKVSRRSDQFRGYGHLLGQEARSRTKAADVIIQRAKDGTLSKARRPILSPSRWPSSFAARKCAPAQTRLSAHSLASALKLANDRVIGLGRSCAV
jgi:hypothetical protein